MRCPVCQTENSATARVCKHCGGGLTASAAGSGIPGTGGFADRAISNDREAAKPAMSDMLGVLPTRFESYEILRKEDGSLWELGRGAMGITYKAIDTDLQVPVALKVINPTVLGNHDAADRFLREARSAAKLRHGNIASVFRLGRAGDTHFYAMEFCEGQTVHQLVDRRGPLELRLALEMTWQVTNALVVAQDHGVVHRDIKPSNLMVTGRVPDEFTIKVIDFGLAKHTAPDSAAIDVSVASNRGGFVGTAHFASPEQLEDRPVDFRSDIYSLGVTLWFMLTGRPLFEGSLTRVVTQHLVQKPPMEKLPWLPARIAALLESMLAKEIEARPASTRALRDQLQTALDEASLDVTFTAQPDQMPVAPPPSAVRTVPASTAPPAPISSVPPAPPPSSAPRVPPTIPPVAMMPTRLPPPAPPASSPPPPPPMVMPSSVPARPKPSSAGPIVLVSILLVFLVIAALGAGYAFNRWGRQLLTKKGPITNLPTEVQPATPAPPSKGTTTELVKPDVLRELRLAQEAAEKLSQDLHRAETNDQLIALVQSRPRAKPEDTETYRITGEVIERNIIDDEQQYLITAKRLAGASPDALRDAFDSLDKEIATAGIGWRVRVTELLRKRIPNVAPEATRVDSQFREELKALQTN